MDSEDEYISDDDITDFFDGFIEHHSSVCVALTGKDDSIQLVQEENDKLMRQNEKLKEECSTLQATVDECQDQLQVVCGLQEKIRDLKDKLQEKEEAIQASTDQWKASLDELQQRLVKSLEEQKVTLTNSHKLQMENTSKKIQELETNNARLEQTLETLVQEKTAEISNLKMKYEGKLRKVSQENDQFKRKQQSFINQEVLRKKMQHMKTDHEREMACLKSKMADLEQSNEKIRLQMQKQNSQAKSPSKQSKLSFGGKQGYRGKDRPLSLSKS